MYIVWIGFLFLKYNIYNLYIFVMRSAYCMSIAFRQNRWGQVGFCEGWEATPNIESPPKILSVFTSFRFSDIFPINPYPLLLPDLNPFRCSLFFYSPFHSLSLPTTPGLFFRVNFLGGYHPFPFLPYEITNFWLGGRGEGWEWGDISEKPRALNPFLTPLPPFPANQRTPNDQW